MINSRYCVLACSAIAMGVICGVLAAPLFHVHSPGVEMLRPQWAHEYDSLDAMSVDVDAVVIATVDGTRPGRTVLTASAGHPLPFTLVDLTIEQVVRGKVGESITVEQTGGTINGTAFYVDGDGGMYQPGEKVLLFVNAQPDTGYYYLVHPQGRYHVINDELFAVAPESPAGKTLDGQGVRGAVELIKSAR